MLRTCGCIPEKSIYCTEAKRLWQEVDRVFYQGFPPQSPEYQIALEEYEKHLQGGVNYEMD